MNKRVNLYFFGDIGVYDEYSPAYVCSKKFVPEILYLIAENKQFNISKKEIIDILNISSSDFEEIIELLERIKFIDKKDDNYKVNFPVFLERDLELLKRILGNIGKSIGEIILKNKKYIYNKILGLSNYSSFRKERLLYHIICDDIFDGTAFDYFDEKGLFCISKTQPGNRDYITIAYEDNDLVENHSNKLLCSSNNFKSKGFVFNSFGDSNGQRKDMYKFFRATQKALEYTTKSKDLNLAYIKIIDNKNREIAEECGQLIVKILNSNISYMDLTNIEKEVANLLKNLKYISFKNDIDTILIEVPIFNESDRVVIKEISDFILNEIFESVKQLFIEFGKEAKDLTSFQHGVNIKEVLNELWHQVFGLTNEYLIKKGFVENPQHISGEGRYLKSVKINLYNKK